MFVLYHLALRSIEDIAPLPEMKKKTRSFCGLSRSASLIRSRRRRRGLRGQGCGGQAQGFGRAAGRADFVGRVVVDPAFCSVKNRRFGPDPSDAPSVRRFRAARRWVLVAVRSTVSSTARNFAGAMRGQQHRSNQLGSHRPQSSTVTRAAYFRLIEEISRGMAAKRALAPRLAVNQSAALAPAAATHFEQAMGKRPV